MIIYEKFWQLLKRKEISQYNLITYHGISRGQLHRLKQNKNINTATLNRLCEILDCQIEDIVEYRKE